MTKTKQTPKDPIRPSLNKLELWDKIAFPVERLNTVKVTATNLSLLCDKKFTTHVKRDTNEILVVRVK